MARKCLVCISKQRDQIEKEILRNKESASTIGRRYSVPKKSVLGHRREHMTDAELKESAGTSELKQMLKSADRLIVLLERHLKMKPRTAVSIDWIRESRDLRGWYTYRSKHIGKVVPAGEGQRREGDRYVVSFVAPDGKRAEIPLSVYRALPPEAFKDGERALETQSNAREKSVEA